jgi:hypothetical protein
MKTTSAHGLIYAWRVIIWLSLWPCLVHGQAIDPDTIVFTTIAIWPNLRTCLQTCFIPNYNINDVQNEVGCQTNACLCRPDTLGQGVAYVGPLALSVCSDIQDSSSAISILTAYCAAKGYTSIISPTTLLSTGMFLTIPLPFISLFVRGLMVAYLGVTIVTQTVGYVTVTAPGSGYVTVTAHSSGGEPSIVRSMMSSHLTDFYLTMGALMIIPTILIEGLRFRF